MVLLTENLLYGAVTLIIISLTSVYLYFKHTFSLWKKLGVPYLEPQFPYGNFGQSVKAEKPIGEVLLDCYNIMKSQGKKFFGIYFFHNPIFVTLDPDLDKTILSRDFSHFIDRGVYHNEEADPLSATLFSLEGQKWKTLRAKLSPTFTSGKLKKMFQTLVNCSLELKDCLNGEISKNEPINIKKILVQYTTDVIGTCAFGIECNSFKNPNTEFIQSGKKIFSPHGFERIKLFLAFTSPWLAKQLNLKITNKDVDSFYRNLVKDTIEYREKNNVTRNDFMQLLIQLKNKGVIDDDDQEDVTKDETELKLTLDQITAQAFIFFVAGFETSSTTLTWALFELAQNQEIQNKARDDIVKVLKKHEGKITYDSVMEMHYMERVIQEALRKYPPIMFLQRVANTDYTIPSTDIVLKKGQTVFIPVFGIHKDPEYYPDPERFDPDRFTEENKATRPDYTWLPFGDGPRFCIGQRFGMMQVKVGLCQLLLNYRFTLNPKTVNPPVLDPVSFVTSAKDLIWLNAERVTN